MAGAAIAELSWYFREADGECGLVSVMGTQLAAIQAGRQSDSRSVADAHRVEDDLHRRLGPATRARRIASRLVQLDAATVTVLRVHVLGTTASPNARCLSAERKGKKALDIDPVATLLPRSASLVASQLFAEARGALRVARTLRGLGLVSEYERQLSVARRARHEARFYRQQLPVAPEVLREALRRAAPAEVAAIQREAAESISRALRRYEATIAPEIRPARLALHDPRPWRRKAG